MAVGLHSYGQECPSTGVPCIPQIMGLSWKRRWRTRALLFPHDGHVHWKYKEWSNARGLKKQPGQTAKYELLRRKRCRPQPYHCCSPSRDQHAERGLLLNWQRHSDGLHSKKAAHNDDGIISIDNGYGFLGRALLVIVYKILSPFVQLNPMSFEKVNALLGHRSTTILGIWCDIPANIGFSIHGAVPDQSGMGLR